jgi:hypothetical protein
MRIETNQHSGGWEPYGQTWRVKTIDGRIRWFCCVMRRKVNGVLQFREMTDDEYIDYSAW